MRWIVLAALVAATPAMADGFWSYKDWIVTARSGASGIDCTARGGREGWPGLWVETSSADTKPPALYPRVRYAEIGIRGIAPDMKNGEAIRFVVDGGASFATTASVGLDSEGIPRAEAILKRSDSQPLLAAMRRGNRVDIMSGGKRLQRISLSGFTASYGKMAEQCRFKTVGVID